MESATTRPRCRPTCRRCCNARMSRTLSLAAATCCRSRPARTSWIFQPTPRSFSVEETAERLGAEAQAYRVSQPEIYFIDFIVSERDQLAERVGNQTPA